MDVRQYASAKLFLEKLTDSFPNVVSQFDQTRLKAYAFYEDLYKGNAESYKVLIRGDDEEGNEVYIPSAKKVVNTTSRFLGVDLSYELEPKSDEFKKWMDDFWDREAIRAKHESNKRWGLVRGDELWWIIADKSRKPGERISIEELKPNQYFPIVDDNDETRLLGIHIVDEVIDPRDEHKVQKVARRQTYRYVDVDPDDVDDADDADQEVTTSSRIEYSEGLYELGRWDDRKPDNLVELIEDGELRKFLLPPQITKLPVYHIRNDPDQNEIFGQSECTGIETLINAINQTMSDEDLTLAIRGLGIWSTDSGPPLDEFGRPTVWEISPARMIEREQGSKIELISGVVSIDPTQGHIEYAEKAIQQGVGVPDIAAGVVDVQIAESGIALKLQLNPILAKNKEKEMERKAKLDQMWHDLIHMWIPAYEPEVKVPDGIKMKTVYGDPMPRNVDKEFERILSLFEAKLISAKTAIKMLNERCGMDIDENDFEQALEDAKKIGEASDPIGSRMAQEKMSGDNDESGNGDPGSNGRVPSGVGAGGKGGA